MVSEYAKDALSWAVSKGYLKGTEVEGVTLLNPLASITRAEMAALLMRYDRAQ
ncbi:MAG: S-layer homology domain-containing protein [Clostridia bacterium]|nr:S-layer homology domain-containing protein [Clostridia bacterium]